MQNQLYTEGRSISILTSACFSNCGGLAMATTHIHGTVASVTEKAVKIENEQGFCWFPKKALVKATEKDGYVSCRVAKWFSLERFHVRMTSEPSFLVG